MSAGRDLLEARGVTPWPADVAVSDLEELLRSDGRTVVLLDGTDVEDKAGFLLVCEQAFALPDWFGRNWDALDESLADLDLGDGLVVLWTGWELFAEAEPDEYATALDIFADAARRYELDGASFVVLLLGETDDLDIGPDDELDAGLDDPEPDEELDLDETYDDRPGESGPG